MCVYLCAYTIINVHLVFIYVHVYPVIIKEHYVHVLFIVNLDIYVRFYVLICVFRNPVNTMLFWPFYRSKLHDGILPISKFPQRVSVSVQAFA